MPSTPLFSTQKNAHCATAADQRPTTTTDAGPNPTNETMSSDASDHSSALFNLHEEDEDENSNDVAAADTKAKAKGRLVPNRKVHDAFGSMIDDWYV
jgi:hypothetical protein